MKYGLLIFILVLLASCDNKVKQNNKRGLEYMKQGLYDQAIVEFNNSLIHDNDCNPAKNNLPH